MWKVQLGTNISEKPGWLNTDAVPESSRVVFLDARERFPLATNSIHYIYAEHLIEHLTPAEARSMLSECHRVLQTSGVLRLATPDINRIMHFYHSRHETFYDEFIHWWIGKFGSDTAWLGPYASVVVNGEFRNWGHQFIYDRETLTGLLHMTGFSDVTFHEVGQSDDPHLRGIEQHGQSIGSEEYNQVDTMVLEARMTAPRLHTESPDQP